MSYYLVGLSYYEHEFYRKLVCLQSCSGFSCGRTVYAPNTF